MTLAIEHARTIANDPILFAEKMLLVQDKAQRFVPLRYNRAQRHFLSNRTSRDLVLKARQLGFSTAIQAELFRLYTTAPESVLVMSDTSDNTTIFRRMVQGFYDNLPPALPKPQRSVDNATITVYPQMGSEIHIRTAGAATSGRSTSFTRMHGSEVAFWKNGGSVIAGALQAVPEHLDDTWVVFESTANGAQGWFYNECMAALQGNSEWKLHFYAWWWDDDYQLALEPGEQIAYTDEEQALVSKHGLSPEQIKWRRHKQRDLKSTFQQEFPETPESAFIHSGQGAFPNVDMALYNEPETEPIEGDIYIAGIDWGQDPNFSSMSIMNQTKNREVFLGRWRRMPYHDMRAAMVKEMVYWGVSGVMPEANSMGKGQAEELYNQCYSQLPNIVFKLFWASNPKKHEAVTLMNENIESYELKLLDDPVGTVEAKAYTMRQLASGLYSYAGPDNSDTNNEEDAVNDDTVIARLTALYGCNSMFF